MVGEPPRPRGHIPRRWWWGDTYLKNVFVLEHFSRMTDSRYLVLRAVVVATLVKQSVRTPDICSLNSVISKFYPNKTAWASFGRKKYRVETREVIRFVWSLCVRPQTLDICGPSICPTENLEYLLNGFKQNFQGLLGWSAVTFGWEVLPSSPPQVGPGLHPVLFPEVEQVHGCLCYLVVSYHFGKLSMSQTTVAECICDFMATGGPAFWVTRVGIPRGGKFFWEFGNSL